MGDNAFNRILNFVLAFITIFISLLSIATIISSNHGGFFEFFAFYGLFQPLMILMNLLFLVYWIIKLNYIALIPLLALILNIGFINSIYQVPFMHKKVEKVVNSKITIATYNAHGFYHGERPLTVSLVSEFMKSKDVDILCLQEMDYDTIFTIDSIARSFSYLPYHTVALSSKKGFNLMVLSKFPILKSTKISFGKEGNQAMEANLLIAGDTVSLFNFHLQTTNFNQAKFPFILSNWVWDTSGEAEKSMTVYKILQQNLEKRTAQAAYIHQRIIASKYPKLVCGDMNSIPASYTYHQIKSNLKDGFKTCGSGYEYTLIGLFKLYRIDYIFHSDYFKGMDYKSYQLDYSDHKTVIMNLCL